MSVLEHRYFVKIFKLIFDKYVREILGLTNLKSGKLTRTENVAVISGKRYFPLNIMVF